MTNRFDEDNILDYLHSFNKNHIRPTNHAHIRFKQRNFSLDELSEIITKEKPVCVKQQGSKKFSLIYEYDDNNVNIVVAIKDKFINIPTVHKIKKR
jgi:ABC-type microcin C transport system permease subunit YejE